jgi:hypothetical protein
LTRVLSTHTSTPDDCFFALWDGLGDIDGSPSVALLRDPWARDTGDATDPAVPPAFPEEVMAGPRVEIPSRTYLLFRGALGEAGDWGAADLAPRNPRTINSPNLMWPADHAWFVATEIDMPWTGSAAATNSSRTSWRTRSSTWSPLSCPTGNRTGGADPGKPVQDDATATMLCARFRHCSVLVYADPSGAGAITKK